MPRKPKHSGDNQTPDEDIIIEGTAEHIRDDNADNKAKSDQTETEDKVAPAPAKKRGLGRILWMILLAIGILAALAAVGLAISNRLLITQQQDASAAQDINSRTVKVETALAALEDEVSRLRDAVQQSQNAQGTNAEILSGIPSRLTAMEDHIIRLDGIITTWQDQLSETPNANADPDVMILARQLAEMEQRLLDLEAERLSPSANPSLDADNGNPASQDQEAEPSASPMGNSPAELSAITDGIINAARQGQSFAELLEMAVTSDARWNALEPWAENPPPAREQLWQDLAVRGETVFVSSASSPSQPAEDDSGWWSWLTSPFSDTITIAPIDQAADAKAQFLSALERRDPIAAIAELKAWSDADDEVAAWIAAWQMQFNARQDLDQAITNLMTMLGQ